MLHLGPGLSLDADYVAGGSFALVGRRGADKTFTAVFDGQHGDAPAGHDGVPRSSRTQQGIGVTMATQRPVDCTSARDSGRSRTSSKGPSETEGPCLLVS